MNNLIPYSTWCGTEASYQTYMDALAKYDAFMKDKKEGDFMAPAVPYVKVGNTGVIKISGSLVPGEVPKIIHEYFGVLGYENIKHAAVAALADKEVKSIFMQIGSGGGAVQGLKGTADFMKEVGTRKPITAHTDSMMASAAYWLGSTAQHVSAGDMAKVGSLGVIAVHSEMTNLRKEMGITDTIFRAGKYKAMGHPLEKLSQDGTDVIQAEIDYMYGKFLAAVSENRGRSMDTVDTIMGQGRVFMGEQALAVGLVDAVESAQEALARASSASKGAKVSVAVAGKSAQASLSADNSASQPTEDETMLTDAQKQALAAGASLESVLAASAEESSQEEVSAEAMAKALEGTANVEPPADPALAESQTALANAQAELASVKSTASATESALAIASAEIETQKTAADALATIVSGITNQMNIAMGRSKQVYAATDAAASYAATMTEFKAKFPVGGVALNSKKAEPESQAANPVSPREWEAARNLFKTA